MLEFVHITHGNPVSTAFMSFVLAVETGFPCLYTCTREPCFDSFHSGFPCVCVQTLTQTNESFETGLLEFVHMHTGTLFRQLSFICVRVCTHTHGKLSRVPVVCVQLSASFVLEFVHMHTGTLFRQLSFICVRVCTHNTREPCFDRFHSFVLEFVHSCHTCGELTLFRQLSFRVPVCVSRNRVPVFVHIHTGTLFRQLSFVCVRVTQHTGTLYTCTNSNTRMNPVSNSFHSFVLEFVL